MKFVLLALLVLLSIPLSTWGSMNGEHSEQPHSSEKIQSVFGQKGGMLIPGNHSVYIRTNDEWTGFSTFYVGYRYGINRMFNIAVEGGVSAVPHVYLGAVLTHWRLYESPNKRLFVGLRTRTGYRYQDSDFSTDNWEKIVGENYLVLKRNGIYMAADITMAVRFGNDRRHCFYYTIYPKADVDFVDDTDRVHFLFSPITVGYEKRLRKHPRWNIAIEAGYAFPIPWNSIEEGKWVNFPSLANVGFYYRW